MAFSLCCAVAASSGCCRRLAAAPRRQLQEQAQIVCHGPQSTLPAASAGSAGRPLPSVGNHAAACATGLPYASASARRYRPRARHTCVAGRARSADSDTRRRTPIRRRSYTHIGRVGCAYARHTRSTLPLLMIKALEFQYQPAEGDELEPRARGTAPGQAIRRFVLPLRTVSPTLRGTAGA
jgi:hypothetical protein